MEDIIKLLQEKFGIHEIHNNQVGIYFYESELRLFSIHVSCGDTMEVLVYINFLSSLFSQDPSITKICVDIEHFEKTIEHILEQCDLSTRMINNHF